MAKRKIITITIALIVVLAIVGLAIYGMLFFSKTTEAILLPEKGTVEINSGSGFQAVTTQTNVDENDIIKTGPDSSAQLIIYESVLITLESNTQVTLADLKKDNIQVSQQAGSTWNKFTKLNGVTGYTLTTPTSVAAVRGTEFGLNNDRLIVAEGTVALDAQGQKLDVAGDEKAEISTHGAQKKELTSDDMEYMITRLEIQRKQLQQLRTRELEKHDSIIKVAQTKYTQLNKDGNPGSLNEMLDAADNGDVDLENAEVQIPIKAEWVGNVFDLTRKIKDQKDHIAELKKHRDQMRK